MPVENCRRSAPRGVARGQRRRSAATTSRARRCSTPAAGPAGPRCAVGAAWVGAATQTSLVGIEGLEAAGWIMSAIPRPRAPHLIVYLAPASNRDVLFKRCYREVQLVARAPGGRAHRHALRCLVLDEVRAKTARQKVLGTLCTVEVVQLGCAPVLRRTRLELRRRSADAADRRRTHPRSNLKPKGQPCEVAH